VCVGYVTTGGVCVCIRTCLGQFVNGTAQAFAKLIVLFFVFMLTLTGVCLHEYVFVCDTVILSVYI